MRSYAALGYALIAGYVVLAALLAPPALAPLVGAAVGAGYLIAVWFLGGVYLSDILHIGISHRALDFRPGFVNGVTLANTTFGIYVDPVSWVNRHRHHHAYSDQAGDPNKHADDGFWKTLYLSFAPYPCEKNLATDAILETAVFRFVRQPGVAVASQISSFGVIWMLVRSPIFALTLWAGVRVIALWVNMIQNFWTHDRRFGTRRYDDAHDNAMNIGEFLPVTATFSACLQNNHHHHPQFLRLSHDPREYDFGFLTVRALHAIGVVRPSASGRHVPDGVSLPHLGL